MDKISRIVIFYFSGTGNAKQVSLWFSEFSKKRGIDCQIFDIAKTSINNVDTITENPLIVIVSPVHGFNFPKITLRFIRYFPKGKNRIVLMNTRAGMRIGRMVTPGLTGVCFMLSATILKSKGYKIVGEIPFDMPSNWISIHPALTESAVKFLHRKNYEKAERHFNKIISGKLDFLARRDIIQDILIAPISLGYYFIGRFAFAKTFYASANCDNCGLCVKQCPVKAIKIVSERPYWTFNCESCMRCMNSCPKKAIETAHGLFIATSLLYSTLVTILLDNILKITINSGTIRFLLSILTFMTLLWGFYYVQHLLLKNKFIGNLISFFSLTHYKFWGRYRSIENSRWQ